MTEAKTIQLGKGSLVAAGRGALGAGQASAGG